MTHGDLRVVRAAAGCGKTTELAVRYLRHLAEGVDPRKAVAITFTRRAAAELEERVALALRACLPDAAGQVARDRLGRVWDEVYRPVSPTDPEVARRALVVLPEAPIGTTDTFVVRLLSEFALWAALPLPDGTTVPLDVPIASGGSSGAALTRAARRLLDPPGDAPVRPEVATLLRYWSLDELVPMLGRRTPWDRMELADTTAVLAPWAAEVGRLLFDPLSPAAPAEGTDVDAWGAALVPHTNQAGQWALPQVARWCAAGRVPEQTPLAVFGWLAAVNLTRAVGKQIRAALQGTALQLGPGTLDLWALVHALRFPYDDPDKVKLADSLRAARGEMRKAVVSAGARHAALAGELGYDDLLSAATALCEAPPPELRDRFQVLLVDEIQDANPGQHALYRAMAAIDGLKATFVGDSRQSVYLFRDAEPELLVDLERRHSDPTELRVNHRSAPRLVGAHRALFDALERPMQERRWRPVASLATLLHDPKNEGLALPDDHPGGSEPVHVVVADDEDIPRDDDLDARTLEWFLARLQAANAEPDRPPQTAVVLAPSWSVAERACRWIRNQTGRQDAAFVEGSAGRAGSSRVSDDLRLFLRALSDRDDSLAWLGVWRHPAVQLTDGALARGVAGVGLVARDASDRLVPWREGRRTSLGWWLDAEALGTPHGEADQAAFARAAPALRGARDALGRSPTSHVLDHLLDALELRTVWGAGPGGDDDLNELDVLLDWVRERDARGVPVDQILVELDDERLERPVVRAERPAGSIACTTLFQAKGLAWDHVCVVRPGHLVRGRFDSEVQDGWLSIPGGADVRLEGLSFDPDGGLSPFKDPIGRLAARLHHLRLTEECARFAYVAITRARRTVTLGLPRKVRDGRSRGDDPQLKDLLPKAWLAPLDGVRVVQRPRARAPGPRPPGVAFATDAPTPAPREVPTGWDERAPSSLGAWLTVEARAQFADAVAAQVNLQRGLFVGRSAVHPPGADPSTGRPLPEHPLRDVSASDLGTLAHGWLATWGFRGEPELDAITAFVDEAWAGEGRDGFAAWLRTISLQLREVGGPLWERVTDPKAKLRFEYPLLGASRIEGRPVSLAGRMDLLVEGPRRRCAVVDFKAGGTLPTSARDLVVGASLRTYAFQLHAYADALRRAGLTVDLVGLWFVRSGTQVTWSPVTG